MSCKDLLPIKQWPRKLGPAILPIDHWSRQLDQPCSPLERRSQKSGHGFSYTTHEHFQQLAAEKNEVKDDMKDDMWAPGTGVYKGNGEALNWMGPQSMA